jgi:RNA polymerase sigma factor (sigma-70 family)
MEAIKNFPDAEIVAGIRNGTGLDDAVRAIYRDHFDSLCWYVLNNSGSRQDAEDIFQEVVVSFIQLVQQDRFRGESSVRTFLFSLNRHTWLNELKRRGRALAREEKFEKGRPKEEADVSQHIAEREDRSQVISLVEKLGEACKKILLLFYFENLSISEILDRSEYENEQVVRNKKYKCMKQLEQMISADPILKQTLKNLLHG